MNASNSFWETHFSGSHTDDGTKLPWSAEGCVIMLQIFRGVVQSADQSIWENWMEHVDKTLSQTLISKYAQDQDYD